MPSAVANFLNATCWFRPTAHTHARPVPLRVSKRPMWSSQSRQAFVRTMLKKSMTMSRSVWFMVRCWCLIMSCHIDAMANQPVSSSPQLGPFRHRPALPCPILPRSLLACLYTYPIDHEDAAQRAQRAAPDQSVLSPSPPAPPVSAARHNPVVAIVLWGSSAAAPRQTSPVATYLLEGELGVDVHDAEAGPVGRHMVPVHPGLHTHTRQPRGEARLLASHSMHPCV
jgi:hypothetical protein